MFKTLCGVLLWHHKPHWLWWIYINFNDIKHTLYQQLASLPCYFKLCMFEACW